MERKECSYTGCGRPHFAHTLCHAHYEQNRRGGPLRPVQARRPKGSQRERDEHGRKLCIRCNRWVPETDFVPDPSHADGLSTYCRPCRSAYSRAWRYGLSADDLARRIHDQGGACALCPANLADGYCVDHDHGCCPGIKSCGSCVRGLLCQECNRLVGKLERDRGRLAKMLRYIERNTDD